VVLKAGRGKTGEKAVATHTGSLVGDYETYQAVFKQAGLIEADSLEEFWILARPCLLSKCLKMG